MITHKTKIEAVLEALRGSIQKGEIRAGQWIRQDALAEHLGVSLTPVREALRQLEVEGLLTYIPHKGVRVAELSEDDARDIYMVRALVEGFAARLAVQGISGEVVQQVSGLQEQMEKMLEAGELAKLTELNDEFHATIYEAAGSRRLREIILRLWGIFPWDTLWVIPNRAQRSVEEHRDLVKAIKRRDADMVARLVQHHIESAGDSVVRYLGGQH